MTKTLYVIENYGSDMYERAVVGIYPNPGLARATLVERLTSELNSYKEELDYAEEYKDEFWIEGCKQSIKTATEDLNRALKLSRRWLTQMVANKGEFSIGSYLLYGYEIEI